MHSGSRWKACCRLWNKWIFMHHSWRHWKKKKHAKLFKLAWHLLDIMTWGTAGTNSWASGMSVLTLPSPWATLAKSVHNLKCLRKAKKHKEQCVFMHMHCGHRFWCTDIKPNLCSLIPPSKKKKMFPCVKNDQNDCFWTTCDAFLILWRNALVYHLVTNERALSLSSKPLHCLSAGDQLDQQLAASRA